MTEWQSVAVTNFVSRHKSDCTRIEFLPKGHRLLPQKADMGAVAIPGRGHSSQLGDVHDAPFIWAAPDGTYCTDEGYADDHVREAS